MELYVVIQEYGGETCVLSVRAVKEWAIKDAWDYVRGWEDRMDGYKYGAGQYVFLAWDGFGENSVYVQRCSVNEEEPEMTNEDFYRKVEWV